MNLFKVVAPFYDVSLNLVGHGRYLDALVKRIDPAPGETLLDLGGGTGRLLDYLPKEVEVTLVDSSGDMLKRAGKRMAGRRVHIVQARAEELPFSDDAFHYVVMADSLHHFSRVESSLREVKRVVASDGAIYILEFHPRSLLTRCMAGAERLAGEPANYFEPEELSGMLSDEGLHTVHEELSRSVYMVVASLKCGEART